MEEAKILYGKDIAEDILLKLRQRIVEIDKKGGKLPGLAIIVAGEDPASALYVRTKKKACQKLGIAFHSYMFGEEVSDNLLLDAIEFLNHDSDVSGILVQLPLPKKFNTNKIIKAISPRKDVDGFHPENVKKFESIFEKKYSEKDPALYEQVITPPVLKAVITLLGEIEESLAGKKGYIVAKNEIFAKPLKAAVGLKNIDAEIISPEDNLLKNKLKESDIIFAAAGKPLFIKEDMVKEGAIIIDIGTTLINGKLKGDADFEDCFKKASYISPVPCGIGPLTVAYLLENTVKFWEKSVLNKNI